MKRTFLFIYENLNVGGIDDSVIKWIKVFAPQGMRIIWLRYGKPGNIFAPWKKALEENHVEIVDLKTKNYAWCKHREIVFEKDEEVYAVSFAPIDFVRIQELSKEAKERYGCIFNTYYIVPHFEGTWYNLDEMYWPGPKREEARQKLSRIYNGWYQNNSLLFFSERHEVEMNNHYNVPCLKDQTRLYLRPDILPPFDYGLAQKRAERKRFIITTCSRFDFPHKGYLFGLVDTYAKLKQEFPQVELWIVGYGDGESAIKKHVNALPTEAAKDVRFFGKVNPYEMEKIFNESTVNVSVAGAVCDGAATGLVSIAARHYHYGCEVYGWFAPGNENAIRETPGEPLEGYLRELLAADDDTYIELCKKSYEVMAREPRDPDWLFRHENVVHSYYKADEVDYIKSIYYYDQGLNTKKIYDGFVIAKTHLANLMRKAK